MQMNEETKGLPVVAWSLSSYLDVVTTSVERVKGWRESKETLGDIYELCYATDVSELLAKRDAELAELREALDGAKETFKEQDRELDEALSRIDTLQAELAAMRGVLDEVHSWIVCACITTPDDMMGNAERIATITAPDYAAPRQVAADPMAMLDLRVEALKASPWDEHADRTGAFVKGALWHAMRNGSQVAAEVVQVPREWLDCLIGEVSHGWGEGFAESAIADEIRALLATSQGEA